MVAKNQRDRLTNRKGTRTRHVLPGHIPNDLHSSSKPYLLMFTTPPKIASSFQHMSLWGTLHIQTTKTIEINKK
jgi:hypothetical protein